MLKFIQIFIVVLMLTLFSPCLFSANISIPENALSLKEAINLASDGDTILLNLKQVPYIHYQPVWPDGGIKIENKNINIKGNIPGIRTEIVVEDIFLPGGLQIIDIDSNNPANLLVIIGSNVTIENVEINHPVKAHISQRGIISSPIQVVSGFLHMNNVHVIGNIIVYSNLEVTNSILEGWAFLQSENGKNDKSTEIAAIDIRNCTGGLIDINNVIIDSNKNGKGYRAITVSDSQQCTINIKNSNIQSGSSFGEDHLYPSVDRKAHGIHVKNSQEIRINLQHSTIIGGTELGVEFLSNETLSCEEPCQSITEIHRRYPSGSGIRIEDSSVTISEGIIKGGKGADGIYVPGIRNIEPNMLYQAGNGGHGLELINSVVTLDASVIIGAKGGIPASDSMTHPGSQGENGQNLFKDSLSTVFVQSKVTEWELYN